MEEIVSEAADLLQGWDSHIVTMRRWGDREDHSYVIGVFSTFEKAKRAAIAEERDRGGKYESEIVKVKMDIPIQHGEDHASTAIYEKMSEDKWLKEDYDSE